MKDMTKFLDNAFDLLKRLIEDTCFEELDNLVNSNSAFSQKLYDSLCSKLNFKTGDSGNVILENDNILRFASLSLVYSSQANKNIIYPLFFNQQRENMRLSFAQDNLFIFEGFEALYDFNETLYDFNETLYDNFLSTLREINGKYIITAESILHIIDFYTFCNDIEIAISDYIFFIKNDKKQLGDFSLTITDILELDIPEEYADTLKVMHSSQRLDRVSFNSIAKGIQI